MGLVDFKLDDIGNILKGAGSLAKDIRSAITGEISPEKKAELEAKILELDSLAAQGQIQINMIEAKHTSIFVAGWRPAVGWICGFALAYHFLLNRVIEWVAKIWWPEIVPPSFEVSELIPVLFALLGLGAYRTYEKQQGVQNKH